MKKMVCEYCRAEVRLINDCDECLDVCDKCGIVEGHTVEVEVDEEDD